MNDIVNVQLSPRALKDMKKIPLHVAIKLHSWMDNVVHHGLSEVRKIPGYHDEPLKGERLGQRSIRLNRSYRAIYVIENNESLRFVEILEVTKHEY